MLGNTLKLKLQKVKAVQMNYLYSILHYYWMLFVASKIVNLQYEYLEVAACALIHHIQTLSCLGLLIIFLLLAL